MKQLAKAIRIAAVGFENKLDKGNKPYILHCFEVMRALRTNDEDLLCIAILHDCVEDKVCTMPDLYGEGFSPRVTTAVELLTHDKRDSYDIYIRKLSVSKDARLVKLSDLKHNSNITRLKGVSESDLKRMMQYHESYTFLETFND